jgi:competence protein ComEA
VSISTDHKALLFVGAIAVLGAGVRIARWSGGPDAAAAEQSALDRQMGSADSAAQAGRRPNVRKKATRARSSRSRGARNPSTSPPPSASGNNLSSARNGPGYMVGRLDLDAATAAQIDSLPGIGPTLAKRIVADRAERGPFVNFAGFRRVKGVGPALVRRLDTLVTFSGTLRPISATPEGVSVPSAERRRPKR